ncbi:MAG: hypothetical protein JXB42_01705 [Deltaproteobacteria bacterium]|nr:hypothetical protein [Deltaproteobacteria bacterium]
MADIDLTIPPRKKQSLSHVWKTSIQAGVKGGEKRSALYTWPRVTLDNTFWLTSISEFNWVKRNLYRHLSDSWGIPLWPDKTQLTAQAASGQKVLTVAKTSYRHFYADRNLIILDPSDYTSYEVGTIASVDSDTQITLEDNLANTWASRQYVIPHYDFTIDDSQSIDFNLHTEQELSFTASEQFESARSFSYSLPASGADTYQGKDLFLFVPYKALKLGFTHPYELRQFLGIGKSWTSYDEAVLRHELSLQENGRASIWSLLNFFDAHQGRYGDFWVPTWSPDIQITSAFGADASVFDISDIEYTTYWNADDIIGKYILFQFPDGTKVCREITLAPSSESIVIDSAIGKAAAPADLDKLLVSFLVLSRFAVDEIRLDYLEGNEQVADVKLTFSSLVGEEIT